jgi:hypothetical protein
MPGKAGRPFGWVWSLCFEPYTKPCFVADTMVLCSQLSGVCLDRIECKSTSV